QFISSDCWAVATTDPDLPDFNRAERCVLRAFLHRTLCCAEPPPPNAVLCGASPTERCAVRSLPHRTLPCAEEFAILPHHTAFASGGAAVGGVRSTIRPRRTTTSQ